MRTVDLKTLAELPDPRYERDTVEHHMMMALVGSGRHVIEIGFRHGTSARAFLAGGCLSMTSFDVSDCGGWPQRISDPRFTFVQRDSILGPRERDECDVLFIDGNRDHEAALADLRQWGRVARERILIHDTNTKQKGPRTALTEWLSEQFGWRVEVDYPNCHGMVVLCR